MRVARTSATLRRSEPCRSDFQLTSETLSPGSRRTACGVGRAPAPVAVAASGRKLQAGRPPGACGPRCRCGELCGCLTSEWSRLGASARLERGRGFPRYQNARRGPLPWEEDSPDCADAALLGDCGVGAAFQRGGPSPEVCAGLHFHRPQSRAEQRVPFGTLKQHLLAQIHRSLFLKKKKPPETGSCSPQGALWNGARLLSSHQLLQTIN